MQYSCQIQIAIITISGAKREKAFIKAHGQKKIEGNKIPPSFLISFSSAL